MNRNRHPLKTFY